MSHSAEPTCEEKFYSVRGIIDYSRDKVMCDTYTYIIALPSSFTLSYKYNVSTHELGTFQINHNVQ
jgi:hypothetical protein